MLEALDAGDEVLVEVEAAEVGEVRESLDGFDAVAFEVEHLEPWVRGRVPVYSSRLAICLKPL